MKETLGTSSEKNLNFVENVKNFREVVNICNNCPEFSSVLRWKDEEIMKGRGSLNGKLTALGNDYQQIFDLYSSRDPKDEKELNEWTKKIQEFLVKLSKIFDEMVIPGNKGKNLIVDGFVKEMFRLNDSFYALNSDIKSQESTAFSQNHGLYEDDYSIKFSVAEMYNTVVKDCDIIKEDNKKLGIFVYRSLLKLTNKELKILLGEVGEKKEILSEKDFEEVLVDLKSLFTDILKEKIVLSKGDFGDVSKELKKLLAEKSDEKFRKISKELFVVDFLNIRSYEDFCKKYDYLKDMQRKLIDLEDRTDECFDEGVNLKMDANIKNLYMKNLKNSLNPNLFQRIIHKIGNKIGKVLDDNRIE